MTKWMQKWPVLSKYCGEREGPHNDPWGGPHSLDTRVVTHEMTLIAKKVRTYPEKSQVHRWKRRELLLYLKSFKNNNVKLFGKEMEIKAFMKKVNNMKTRLKNKAHKNKTGQTSWKCKSLWQKKLLWTRCIFLEANPSVFKQMLLFINTKKDKPFTSKQNLFLHFFYEYNLKQLLHFMQAKGNASLL